MRKPTAVMVMAMLALTASTALAADESDPSIFAGTIMQSLAAVIVFVLLLVILTKYAWAPILRGLQDREEKIRKDLEDAETAARRAAATLKEYESKLAEAQVAAGKVIEQGRADAERLAGQIREKSQHEINQMRDRARADIQAAKEQALNELYEQTATLATEVAGRILRREINAADQQQLVQESLNELTSHN